MAYDKAVDSAALDAGLTSVADAIRQKGGTSASLSFPQGFVDAIGEISGGEDEPWVRPSDWPDIDALAAQIEGDQDCLYLTYDLRETPGYGWIGLYGVTADSSAWTVERGHVAGGAFVADETFSTASRGYFRQALDDADGDVQLWRVSSTGHLTAWGFATNTATSASNLDCRAQPCVERTGALPWCEKWFGGGGTNNNSTSGITYWLEHDHLIPGKNAVVRDLSSCFNSCYSLQSLDLTGWDTSGWAVSNISNCFSSCYSLRTLDLTGWDTSGWAVSNFSGCFNSCYSLRSLDLTGWDTSGWAVSNLSYTWANCYALAELDLSHFDTTNWGVTNMQNLWQNCHKIKRIDTSGWNTSRWTPGTLFYAWNGCNELEEIDVSGWSTAGWSATMGSSFGGKKTRRIKGFENWTWLSAITNVSNPNIELLEDFTGIPLGTNHTYAAAVKLTHQSLLNILNTLPTVTAARTITLGQTNKNKLTAEEIAIATAKGWTVA